MKKSWKFILLVFAAGILAQSAAFAAGPLDPMRVGRYFISGGVGPGTPFFGNGSGFGPALKGTFEAGMWDVGPGVITLGGEATFSFFSHHYGSGWNETWANFIFGARSAYHYGWNVAGLDTYAGVPLGIGFCAHGYDDNPGYGGYTPVYPYFGIFFGATWFFTNNLGVNGEFGYNSTYANIGMVFRVK
jgi:hypothetical protein